MALPVARQPCVGAPRQAVRLMYPLLIVGFLALVLPEGHAFAQVTSIPGTPTCARCELRATRRVVLGSVDGDAALGGTPSSVVKDSRGWYYIGEGPGFGTPLVFDASGRFVRRMGRKGRGPGEFIYGITLFVAPGDSVHVVDFGTGRRSVFGPSGNLVRVVPHPGLTGQGRFGAILPNGDLALNRFGYEADADGLVLAVVNPDGKWLPSFGDGEKIPIGGPSSPNVRYIAASRTGNFWAAHQSVYRFSLWRSDGRLIRRFERANDFFRPDDRLRIGPTPPPARVSSIREDSAGRVWVTVQVSAPREQWLSYLGEPRKNARGREHYPDARHDRMFHTLVEVFDVRAGRLLVSQSFPFHTVAATDDGEYAAYRQDEDGVPYIDIWRVAIIER